MKLLAVFLGVCSALSLTEALPLNLTITVQSGGPIPINTSLTVGAGGPIPSGHLKGKCEIERQNCHPLIGAQCPQCDANGNFLPKQCSGSTGYCWCVNVFTGEILPNTTVPPGHMAPNCDSSSEESSESSSSEETKEDKDSSSSEETKEDKDSDSSSSEDTKEDKDSDSASSEETKEDKDSDSSSSEETKEDKDSDSSSSDESKKHHHKKDKDSDSPSSEETKEDKDSDSSSSEETKEDKDSDSSSSEETKEDKDSDSSSSDESMKHGEESDSPSSEETKEDKDSDSSSSEEDFSCPDGWTRFGQQCFIFIDSPKTWAEAESYCQFDGSNLASIHSYEENHFLQSLTRGDTHNFPQAWVGGTDTMHLGLWTWSDGSRFLYENWSDHSKDGDSDRCLKINYEYELKWTAGRCSESLPFVCSKDAEKENEA